MVFQLIQNLNPKMYSWICHLVDNVYDSHSNHAKKYKYIFASLEYLVGQHPVDLCCWIFFVKDVDNVDDMSSLQHVGVIGKCPETQELVWKLWYDTAYDTKIDKTYQEHNYLKQKSLW